MIRWLPILLFAPGCDVLASLQGDPDKDCESTAWYADADGDGKGEASTVYVGCEDPPEGYVANHSDETETESGTDTEATDTEVTDTEATDTEVTDTETDTEATDTELDTGDTASDDTGDTAVLDTGTETDTEP